MRFRPCIDIHNGKVKQIVGGSLRDEGDQAKENFVSTQDAAFFAEMYQKDRISGGHVILLNAKDSHTIQKIRNPLKEKNIKNGKKIQITKSDLCKQIDSSRKYVKGSK